MLSTLDQIDGHGVGKHLLVVNLMQGMFNSKPTQT